MANSVVKVTDATNDAISDSLLLLVGEDGTVTPDRQTVDKYLNSKSGPTSLQIMHIDKCDQKGIDVTVDNVMYIPDNMDAEDVKVTDDVSSVIANLHHVRLDHDYTPLTSPKRSSSSAEDDDELAKTLSIIHGSESQQAAATKPVVSTATSNSTATKTTKSINIISSFTIPATTSQATTLPASENQKGVEKKPVETPSVKQKGKAKILHTSPKKKGRGRPPSKKPPSKAEPAEENYSDDEEDMNEEISQDEDEESENEEDSLAIEDDQNDSDFDLEQEITGKKGKRASKRFREDKRKKPVSEPPKESQTPKTAKKSKKRSVSLNDEPNAAEKPSNEPEKPAEAKPEGEEQKEKNDDKHDETKTQDKKPKKKKEPPKPIPGDFALFSTPDIIRKVGGKEPSTPEVTPTTPKSLKTGEAPKSDTPLSKPGKITQESRSKSVTEAGSPSVKHNRLSLDDKDKGHHHQQTSTETKVKDRRDSVEKHKHKSNEEKSGKHAGHHHDRRRSDSSSDSGRVISKQSEETSSKTTDIMDIPSAQDIRAIIMNEDTKTYTTNTIPIPDIPVPMSNNSPPETHSMSLDSSGLDLDQSLLDNISNDDVISEDILYQVAKQLVSNTELQNAIDKGINDGVLDTSSIQDVMDISNASQSSNSSFSENQQSNIIKQGTQIVRPDGRVVVLPPIERPTTRSRNKRKEEVAKPSFKQPKQEHKNKDRTVHKPLDDEHVSGNELDSSGDEMEESEDDPNKLWCICNQPHNNRFMICCDTCEEWYHGKCVNITKAMGQQMESEGKEWICLFCKDPQLKRPIAAARRIRKASINSRQSSDSSNSAKKAEKVATFASTAKPIVPCVVCHKPSRKSSIYCSEACILAHAQKIERVVVFERATGKMLTGNKAPSANHLDQWLKQHPGYEVVRSGGKVVTTKVKPGQFTQSKLKLVKNTSDPGVSLAVQQKGVNIGVMKHAPKNSPQSSPQLATPKGAKIIKLSQTAKETPKVKLIQAQPMQVKPKEQSTPPVRKIQVQTMLAPIIPPGTPVNRTPKKDTPKKETPKEVKPKTPKTKPREDGQPSTPKAENIRDNVQKTIFEQLTVRLKDSDISLTEEEVKNISVEIEAELYKCFGDTGQKYKNKYRSLIFNIKDPKNQTLWRRICEKSISSYELVRLSPDDMASQELAKWREQEAKHQLDMIKKSEIELLNCNRQYVLKTHKGEEVLEDKRVGTKTDNIDIIKSLTEGSTLDVDVDKKRTSSKDRSRDKRKHKGKDKDRTLSRERRDRSRMSSSKDRSRKRSRSKDRSKSEKKKREKRSRSRSRSREKSRERDKNKDKDKYRKTSSSSSSSHKSSRHKKHETISSTDSLDKRSKEILEQLNKIAPPVKEDKLWEHVPQEDIVPGNSVADSDSDHEVPSSTVTIPTPPRTMESEDFPSQSSDDSKMSSRLKEVEVDENRPVSPPLPSTQLWSGTINMVDVAKISITAHEVSGDCTSLDRELSENLDIVGRISPDTVWEYIGKMRSSNSKVISLIRLNATNLEEQMPYLALYSYLSSRNRLGVVKSTNKAIKDFYILPLAAQKPIPQALLPINGPVKQWLEASVKKINDRVQKGFEEARPALLLGIIVRDRRKRPYMDALSHSVTPHKKHRVDVVVMPTPPTRSYTPPPMPPEITPAPPPPLPPTPKMDPRLAKRIASPAPSLIPPVPEMVPAPALPLIPNLPPSLKSLIPSPPITPKVEPQTNDDDEPYSPEDSDPEVPDPLVPNVLNTTAISVTQTTVSTEGYIAIPGLGDDTGSDLSAKKMDIQRQMEELNKQIELQKSEITSITKNIATAAESEIVGSALASIALPSNLQQILDSIKTIGATSSGEFSNTAPKESASEPQSDLTIPLMIPKTFSRPVSSTAPQDTIPLNLPIKPKLTPPLTDSPKSGQEKQSVLSTLSEDDLIKKAAEMLKENDPKPAEPKMTKKEPKPPKPPISFSIPKRPKIELSLPPVPGVDD